jgi:Spy/CpxP family protein refolding chaperone
MYRDVLQRMRAQTEKWVARTALLLALTLPLCLLASGNASSTTTTTATPTTVQAGRGGGYHRSPRRHSGKSSIDARVERISKQLDLSEVQRVDLKKLLESQQTESTRLWNDQKIEPMDRMSKLRALRDNAQKQFEALLTEEQRKKYDELRQRAASASAALQES